MLKYQRPCAWFTSSPEGELIKRSDTKELDPHVIKRQFCEGSKHDCVAYYVSYGKGAKGNRTAKIEYFDDKGLENFLLNRPKENNGIVQKFEEPTSPCNSLIRAYWTPHKARKPSPLLAAPLQLLEQVRAADVVGCRRSQILLRAARECLDLRTAERLFPYTCFVEASCGPLLNISTRVQLQLQQRVNKNQISDLRVLMNERLATFDGPEHLNSEFDIKSYKLKARVKAEVGRIVAHIKKLLPSAYTMWTMECFFKLSGKNKLLFLWCNDLRVFSPNDPPKIETFLAPPVNSHVAPKHKYEKKDLKKEYFRCPCAGFNIDPACDKAGGLFPVEQMKITTYRYMILYHQSQAKTEKDVTIPEDVDLVKLSAYRKKWIEEDEMVKFKENSDVKAFELKSGSLVYQMPRFRDHVRELTGWKEIPPLPVSNADPLVFKFLSKLAIVDGKVVQSHPVNEYSKQDIQDFRRFFHNIVMKEDDHTAFLDRKMKVCDACCIKFTSSADDNISLEMTKLVVGTPNDTFFQTRRSTLRSSMSQSRLLDPSTHSFKAFQAEAANTLPALARQGSGRPPRSKTSLGFHEKRQKGGDEGSSGPRSASAMDGAAGGGERRGSLEAGAASGPGPAGGVAATGTSSQLSMPLPSKSAGRMHSKNVREWIQFFYQEADLRASTAARAAGRRAAASPYEMPLPFRE